MPSKMEPVVGAGLWETQTLRLKALELGDGCKRGGNVGMSGYFALALA